MILVYYRHKDGTIRHCHEYPDSRGLDAVKDAIRCYNVEQAGEDTAYFAEYEDDSIEAYLFRNTVEKKIYDRESVRDLISSMEKALDAARCLEV